MKKIKILASIIGLLLMLAPLVSFAQGGQDEARGIHEPGTGIENPEIKEAGQGTGQGLAATVTTSLQNQGEDQQNQVQLQQQIQTRQGQEGATGTGNQIQAQAQTQNRGSENALRRRSQVANAVQEILQVANRNSGIGQQVRTIAQTQNQEQEQIEASLAQVKNRGQLRKFFFGPDYKNLNSVEDQLANHNAKLAELKRLTSEVSNAKDAEVLEDQIAIMEQVTAELKVEIENESKGFSLFGWLNKMFSK